jgi:hypothetical protein
MDTGPCGDGTTIFCTMIHALVVSWINNVDTQAEMYSIPAVIHNAFGLVRRRPTALT